MPDVAGSGVPVLSYVFYGRHFRFTFYQQDARRVTVEGMKRRPNLYGRYAEIVKEAKQSRMAEGFDPFRRPKVYRHGVDMYTEARVTRHLQNRLEEFRRQIQAYLDRTSNSIPQCMLP